MHLSTAIAKHKNILTILIKLLLCILILTEAFNIFIFHIGKYEQSCKQYDYQNDSLSSESFSGFNKIEQQFFAKGNMLSDITLYIGNDPISNFTVSICDGSKILAVRSINVNEENIVPLNWNTIQLDCKKLSRNKMYTIAITGSELSALKQSESNLYPDIFGKCTANGQELNSIMAVGIHSRYEYFTTGIAVSMLIDSIFAALIVLSLCYTVVKFEKVYASFKEIHSGNAVLYALFFSAYGAFLFCPTNPKLNGVSDFNRTFGIGFIANTDVTKRIDNFSFWFLCFAVTFILLYIFFNHYHTRQLSAEANKALKISKDIIIIADIIIALKAITFFSYEQMTVPAFSYSDYMLFLFALIPEAYIFLHLDKKISTNTYTMLVILGLIISYPISILVSRDFDSGRTLMGIQVIVSLTVIITLNFLKPIFIKSSSESFLSVLTVLFSLIPFSTSLFIEAIPVLNQHSIFISNPIKYYFAAIALGIILCIAAAVFMSAKNKGIRNWKAFVYPALIFGVCCLWCQIPITSVYNADLFESANASILISDFLNYGSIPLVEHYGGHMMSGVWEGLIYYLLNNDSLGAIFTPYAGYIGAVVTLLFYYLIKELWNDDAAVISAVFIPLYSLISYWGLGIFAALGLLLFIRKNSFPRAIFFWFAVIWCCIYRLDLGFSFALGCICALGIYIISEKNIKALKNIALSFLCWAAAGVSIWCIICIVKSIDPIKRLIEFLMLSMSNLTWAYSSIGDSGTAAFSWAYIFIPFAAIICLTAAVFSQKLKKNIDIDIRMFMLVFGFAYIFNFSRGLVRHSLAEGALYVCIWTAYFFLAMFISQIKKEKRLFIPALTGFLLLNSLLVSGNNFTNTSIAAAAASQMEYYTNMWKTDRFADDYGDSPKTAWQQLGGDSSVINRVVWADSLVQEADKYREITDLLLDENETFVDFINKTFVYSALEKKNPVYISQSPLQLSGEFTQEQFVSEIQNVPILFMPFDSTSYLASSALDGIPNVFRNYKVSEYLYQNYTPLCTLDNTFAVWCLKDRYTEMKQRFMSENNDIKSELNALDKLTFNSVRISECTDDTVNIISIGEDPFIDGLRNVLDITPYVGKDLYLHARYESDSNSFFQLFYTTEENEEYSEEKSIVVNTDNKGYASFRIPVTEYSKFRFDIPEGSTVKIFELYASPVNYVLADYGYDGPYLSDNGIDYDYIPYIHNYDICYLPRIWAENDRYNSTENEVITDAICIDGVYSFNLDKSAKAETGNYIKLSFEFNSQNDTADAYLRLGNFSDEKFTPEYFYHFYAENGKHEYLFRVSSDYYWYMDQTNAAVIECSEPLQNISVQILKGD